MLPIIPHDKANHIVYGAAIASMALGVTGEPLVTLALTAFIGVAKEVVDARGDAVDFLVTVFGALLVIVPFVLRPGLLN